MAPQFKTQTPPRPPPRGRDWEHFNLRGLALNLAIHYHSGEIPKNREDLN